MSLKENCYQTAFKNRQIENLINDVLKLPIYKKEILIRELRTNFYTCSCATNKNCDIHLKIEFIDELYKNYNYDIIFSLFIILFLLLIIIHITN